MGIKTVVGLGPVTEELVMPYLGERVRFVNNPSAEDLKVAVGAIVRAASVVDKEALDAMPNLRVLARTGVGTERVDIETCTERNIPVVITPGSNAKAVAEAVFGMMMTLVKGVNVSHNFIAQGKWGSEAPPEPDDISGKTLAIVGYGRIGHYIADFGRAFGMKIIIHDPYVQSPGLENVSIEDAIRRCHIISLNIPGGSGELITPELLATAKPGLVIINCARAELMSLETMTAGLQNGQIGGIGLDVFPSEPVTQHPLANDPRVLLSPHTAGLSKQATRDTFRMAAQGIAAVLSGNFPDYVANESLRPVI